MCSGRGDYGEGRELCAVVGGTGEGREVCSGRGDW